MEVRGVLVHPELFQPAVTHILVQDLNLLHPGHARQVLLRGEGGSVLELQTKVRKDFIITEKAPTRTKVISDMWFGNYRFLLSLMIFVLPSLIKSLM